MLCTLLGFVVVPSIIYGWGGGHNDIQRAILNRLPEDLTSALTLQDKQNIIGDYSHYPDSPDSFDVKLIGQDALQRLEKLGITRRIQFHSDKGRAAVFLELVHAFRQKNIQLANFWIAVLGHSTADMAACNHDPMTHFVLYSWGAKDYHLQTRNGNYPSYFDLHNAVRVPEGQRLFLEEVDRNRLFDDGRELDDAILEIMLYGFEGTLASVKLSLGILDASADYADTKDPSKLVKIQEGMAQLGAWAVVRTLRDTEVARRIAAGSATLELSRSALDRYKIAVKEILETRDFQDDLLFRNAILNQASPEKRAIAISIEPTWTMGESLAGYAERLMGVFIAETLFHQHRDYRLVDIRQLLRNEFPDPRNTPVLIFFARATNRKFHSMKIKDLFGGLANYIQKGGHVLWIGGSPPPGQIFPGLEQSVIRDLEGARWPIPMEQLIQTELVLYGSKKKVHFVRSPETHAGWHVNHCSVVFKEADNLIPILQLRAMNGDTRTVAIAYPEKNPVMAFIPTYALTPHVFTESKIFKTPISQTQLDDVGTEILDEALKHLID